MSKIRASYDAIIIGSGIGGSSLALRLGQTGRKVLLVERGKPLRQDAGNGNVHLKQAMGGWNPPYWPVGGRSKFYGAALYRLRESDFQSVEHENGISPAWPISYTDLEPYYRQAEELYRVHGSSDGDPSEPPRSSSFPHPPIPHSLIVSELVDRLKASGTSVSAIPLGLDYGPGGKCTLCGSCDGYYCDLDAKMDAEIAALRPALATGNVQLLTETACIRVRTNPAGSSVIGVELLHDETRHVVNSEIVAISAGAEGSAALLRRSRSDSHREGLGNDGGCLGRYMAGHSVGMIFPLISWRALPPTHTKSFAINVHYEKAPNWPFPLGVVQVAGQMPFWEGASRLMRPMARLIGTRSLMCFYMSEALPTWESRLLFDEDRVVAWKEPIHNLRTFEQLRHTALQMFRRAGYRVVARRQSPHLWHTVGTARMGNDPSSSVVDPNCQVHGIKRLFVVDASVMPTAGCVNTALSIAALALRAGDFIGAGRQTDF